MTMQQRERIRLGGQIERAQPGARQTTPSGIEYDHRFIASTELLASDGGVIYVDAWRWDRFMKRPRWIGMHDLGAWSGKITEVSLGRAVHVAVESGLDPRRVGPTGKALIVLVKYASTPFAQQVKTLYDEGGLDDVSVRWDWRTEETRNPYEEEVQKYGERLLWVCERADLVELSAVLLGADAGAQMVRSDVLEAVERCRAQNIELPEIERLIRGSRTVVPAPNDKLTGALSKPFAGYKNFADCVVKNWDSQPHPITYCAGLVEKKHSESPDPVDINAAAEALGRAKAAAEMIDNLHAAMEPPRQQFADAMTDVANLIPRSPPNIVDGEPVEPEPSDAAVAFTAVNDALAHLDIARGDVGPAIRAVNESLTQLAEALGLGDLVVDRDGRAVVIDIDAVLADARHGDSPALRKLYDAYQKLEA